MRAFPPAYVSPPRWAPWQSLGRLFIWCCMDIQTLTLRVDRIHDRQDELSRAQTDMRRDFRDLDRRLEKVEMKLFWLSLAGSLAGGFIGAGAPAIARVFA